METRDKLWCANIFFEFFNLFKQLVANTEPLGIKGSDFRFPAAGMDKEEGWQINSAFFIFILIFIQWIGRRRYYRLDSAGKGKDEIYQSTFRLCNVAIVFTRRAVSRINGL